MCYTKVYIWIVNQKFGITICSIDPKNLKRDVNLEFCRLRKIL